MNARFTSHVSTARAKVDFTSSRADLAAGVPYSAHAIASTMEDFPDPLGPMIPITLSENSNVARRIIRKFVMSIDSRRMGSIILPGRWSVKIFDFCEITS